jgi:hypothetical protein
VTTSDSDATSTHLGLWLAFFAGPTAWSLHELLSYAFLKVACGAGLGFVEYLITLAALALAGAGAFAAYRTHGSRIHPARTATDLMWGAAVLIDALFAFAIVMEAIPNLAVSPCL